MMLEVRETPSGSVNNACHLKIGLWKLPPVLLLLAVWWKFCLCGYLHISFSVKCYHMKAILQDFLVIRSHTKYKFVYKVFL